MPLEILNKPSIIASFRTVRLVTDLSFPAALTMADCRHYCIKTCIRRRWVNIAPRRDSTSMNFIYLVTYENIQQKVLVTIRELFCQTIFNFIVKA